MHEITSRFVAQFHSIFDRFSIAKSATQNVYVCGFAQSKPTQYVVHLNPKIGNQIHARPLTNPSVLADDTCQRVLSPIRSQEIERPLAEAPAFVYFFDQIICCFRRYCRTDKGSRCFRVATSQNVVFCALFSSRLIITYLIAVSYENCLSEEPFILAIIYVEIYSSRPLKTYWKIGIMLI